MFCYGLSSLFVISISICISLFHSVIYFGMHVAVVDATAVATASAIAAGDSSLLYVCCALFVNNKFEFVQTQFSCRIGNRRERRTPLKIQFSINMCIENVIYSFHREL